MGLYIHIPFCARKCPYCDFYSLGGGAAARYADVYTTALLQEMAYYSQRGGLPKVDTVYFGGGTPPLLGQDNLLRLVKGIHRHFTVTTDAEITLEANPGLLKDPRLLPMICEAGVNRLSYGAQSAVDAELRGLGRTHRHRDTIAGVEAAAKAGIANISLDIMLGIPGQTAKSALYTIDAFADLGAAHISAYLLKIEPDTAFARQGVAAADEEEAGALYLAAVERLAARGYQQYEISNFAKGGAACRHNLHYWRCEPYLGLGPAAHSFLHGRRFYTPRNLDAFLAGGDDRYVDDGAGGSFEERVMLGLRLNEGIRYADLADDSDSCDRLRAQAAQWASRTQGLLIADRDSLRLTPKGMLVSNAVIGALLA